MLQRETKLLTGIRALVTPDSTFDRAILQPRSISADPTLVWELDPASTIPQCTIVMRGNRASTAMQTALQSEEDFFVEHTDFDGSYSQFLSLHERSLLTVSSRTRIERILASYAQPQHIFVLPHPQTLLCPTRLRKAIEASTDHEQQLALFCLYQASHNHDAATLYPLRLPSEALDDPALLSLKQALLEACCVSESGHPEDCLAKQAVQRALATHYILLTTHKNLLARQASVPDADTIVIDDITDLQMHLAVYSACILTSRQVKMWLCSSEEQRVFTQLETQIFEWVKAYVPKPGYRERLPLSSLLAYLEQKSTPSSYLFLEPLRKVSRQGIQVANVLQKYLTRSAQKPTSPEHLHAYWIDLWFTVDSTGDVTLQQWEMCGLSQDLREIFQQRCWKPYRKHVLAGSALTVGGKNTQFLQRYLSIPDSLPLKQDPRKKKRVYLPRPEVIPPAGFLKRREWIMAVGALLATRIHEKQRTILVTLNNATAAEALILTFLKTQYTAGRQLLAPQLNWTITKINERIDDLERQLLIFASPRLRQTLLDRPVHSEVSGPLRFLNKHDPLVAAQMQVFAHL